MAVSSGFFNANVNGSGERDRVYGADHFGAIFDGIISDGIFEKYGETPFKVVPSTNATTGHLEVVVKSGRAWFDKTWTLNDTDLTIGSEGKSKIDSRDTSLNRIDGIYLVVNKDERQNEIIVVKGDENLVPSLKPVTNIPGHVTYYLLATIYVTAAGLESVDTQITEAEITDMIGKDGGAPYVESLVTDPDITTTTILNNLENEFDSYQSRYNDEFEAWMDSIKDNLGTLSSDQIIEIAEMVANVYSTDYLSGGYPYVDGTCIHMSSEKSVLPPVIINFGFVTGSMYPNKNANELTVYTEELQTGD